MKPLCFVIMPFGKKKDIDGNTINFDDIYHELIHPAIDAADMEPIRADEETVNGIIHKPMYERLILCDYAIADLTTANANVFYELGIRHAVKPFTTITIFAGGAVLPFDLNAVRCYPYGYDKATGLTNTDGDRISITEKLMLSKKHKNTDSPVYQLIGGISFQNSIAHQKTDIFRDKVEYNEKIKLLLENIRTRDASKTDKISGLIEFVSERIKPENEEAGVLIDVMLSFRALSAFKEMIDFIEKLPAHVRSTVMVREQYGFALNRNKRSTEAQNVLQSLISDNGPSSETYGILGRVYKDLSDNADKSGNRYMASANLNNSLNAYLAGFETDWRDAYPGINALTLLHIKGDDARVRELAPVVEYSVRRKIAKKPADYWDYATLFEIGIITNNRELTDKSLTQALGCRIEGSWMFETTLNNLKLIIAAKKQRNEDSVLVEEMANVLQEQIQYHE